VFVLSFLFFYKTKTKKQKTKQQKQTQTKKLIRFCKFYKDRFIFRLGFKHKTTKNKTTI